MENSADKRASLSEKNFYPFQFLPDRNDISLKSENVSKKIKKKGFPHLKKSYSGIILHHVYTSQTAGACSS